MYLQIQSFYLIFSFFGVNRMYKKEYFSDPLLLAVIFNDFETVRTLMDSENYNPTVFTNIFNNINYYGIPIPIHYISQCWDICLGHEF